jgi:hypothetical protein
MVIEDRGAAQACCLHHSGQSDFVVPHDGPFGLRIPDLAPEIQKARMRQRSGTKADQVALQMIAVLPAVGRGPDIRDSEVHVVEQAGER